MSIQLAVLPRGNSSSPPRQLSAVSPALFCQDHKFSAHTITISQCTPPLGQGGGGHAFHFGNRIINMRKKDLKDAAV